jgi:hypothetical protein
MLYWKSHVDQLLTKLSAVWYAIRVLKPFMTTETLVIVYNGYFRLIMNYGIIFWDNSPYSMNIFRSRKKGNYYYKYWE